MESISAFTFLLHCSSPTGPRPGFPSPAGRLVPQFNAADGRMPSNSLWNLTAEGQSCPPRNFAAEGQPCPPWNLAIIIEYLQFLEVLLQLCLTNFLFTMLGAIAALPSVFRTFAMCGAIAAISYEACRL